MMSHGFNHSLHKGGWGERFGDKIANGFENFKNWLASPKTYMLGAETTHAFGPAGATAELGFYFYQEGYKINYGTYSSSGHALGNEMSVDVGASSMAASPNQIQGTSHSVGGSAPNSVGVQVITNGQGNIIGSRLSGGLGGGASLTVEQTNFYSLPCAIGLGNAC